MLPVVYLNVIVFRTKSELRAQKTGRGLEPCSKRCQSIELLNRRQRQSGDKKEREVVCYGWTDAYVCMQHGERAERHYVGKLKSSREFTASRGRGGEKEEVGGELDRRKHQRRREDDLC